MEYIKPTFIDFLENIWNILDLLTCDTNSNHFKQAFPVPFDHIKLEVFWPTALYRTASTH